MTGHEQMIGEARDLVRLCRIFMEEPGTEPAQVIGYCDRLDQFSHELSTTGADYREAAALCRLASGLLRGEDVPESIHVPDGEDPKDTVRWQKWRLS